MSTRSQANNEFQTSNKVVEALPELVVNENNFPDTEELLESSQHSHVKLEKLLTAVRKSSKILQLKQQKTTSKIFRAVWQNQALESLNIYHFNMHCIDPEIISNIPAKLKRLVMDDTGLSEDQTQAFFSGITRNDTLTSLTYLSLVLIDLSGVEPDTLAKALAKLKSVAFTECDLDCEQVEAVLKMIAKKSNITEMMLTGSENEPLDLTEVSPDILALDVNKLERFNLNNAVVTREQADKLLQQVLVKTCLKSLVLSKLTHEDGTSIIFTKDLVSKAEKELDIFQTL